MSTSTHFLNISLNIILSFPHGYSNGHFPSGIPITTLYTPLLSPLRSTCPAHLILLDLITWRVNKLHIEINKYINTYDFVISNFCVCVNKVFHLLERNVELIGSHRRFGKSYHGNEWVNWFEPFWVPTNLGLSTVTLYSLELKSK